MKVNELMTRDLATFQPHATVGELEELMADLDVHALPVVDEQGIAVGIVSASDLGPDVPRTTSAASLMNDRVYTIDHEADAKEAAQMMQDQSVHHLVVTERGRAVGMLSTFDLLRLITQEAA